MNKTIIDVRTELEFNGGNAPGSINIPLHLITGQLERIKSFQQPIVLCCASGNRSGQAVAFLQRNGVECQNGGCWADFL